MPIKAFHSHTVLGSYGESIVVKMFSSDFIAYRPTEHFKADVIVISPYTGVTLRIEVKTARKGKDGRYKFILRKDKHTDLRADFVILQAYNDCGILTQYVIPCSELIGKRQAYVTDNYSGQYAKFRNARYLIHRELQ